MPKIIVYIVCLDSYQRNWRRNQATCEEIITGITIMWLNEIKQA